MALFDAFLKIDVIDGEAGDSKHKAEIELESFSWGESNGGTFSLASGGGAGKVAMQDLACTSFVSKASAKLFLACASGQHIKKVVLSVRKAGKDQQDFLKWTISDVLISGYNNGGSTGGGVIPMDQFSLNFAKIEVEYKEQKADGTLGASNKAGWDLKANKAV